MSDRTVRAAGGVLWRRDAGEVKVALVHRPKYDDWSLPKGKLDHGEQPLLGGLREVWEETGFVGVPGRTLGVSRYRVLDNGRDAAKTVQWWAMQAAEGDFEPSLEVDRLHWLPLPAALARVRAGYDVAPLTAFAQAPALTTTVLVVRHASAGSRAAWDGPDDARPLDATGREQADALADLLPAYRPELVLAAPPLRCVQTVQQTAERTGLLVEPAKEAAGDETAGPDLVALLTDLGREGRPAVVCAQGGGIQAAVGLLTGRPVDELCARKGSLWALSFSGDELVDAAYTATLD